MLGTSVSFNSEGDILAIGAPANSDVDFEAGAVYIFQSSSVGYQQVEKLTATEDGSSSGDRFGDNISLNSEGNLLLAGVYRDEGNTGAAYVFKYTRDY